MNHRSELKGDTMPHASTFVFILAAVVLYAIGLGTPAQCALFLAAGCELVVWKRAADKLRAARATRRQLPRRPHRRG
ncbi:hypothetical protein HH212_24085 [Massilia forsythiae]|uniref:Uncharacterized protein n=2 Tax=Massilia forsythiae TaxID=2728020 RepID=A0A7Z2ZUI0_9BURK|nr:hypothetical protein HH212_24085 [Massilia forsythiae]